MSINNKSLFKFVRIAFSIMVILLFVSVIVNAGSTAFDFGYRVFTEPAMEAKPGTDVLVQIKETDSPKDIGELLENKGLIRDKNLFALQLKLSAYAKKIKPGVYTLNTAQTAKEMIVIMAPEKETETQSVN